MREIIFPKEKKDKEISIEDIKLHHKIAIYLNEQCFGLIYHNIHWIHINNNGKSEECSFLDHLMDNLPHREQLKFYVL